MEKMDGNQRRNKIVDILRAAEAPVSGAVLAKKTGVSRQVIVQDIALLRTQYPIMAAARGYLLYSKTSGKPRRTFAVRHTAEQTREELNTIVDFGGKVMDVIVEHDIYGEIRADLLLSCRKDVEEFCSRLEQSKSGPLNVIGCGVHYHTVEAENEAVLEEIGKALHLYLI